jgi:hypothetical protein
MGLAGYETVTQSNKRIDPSRHKELRNLIKTPSKIIFTFWDQMLWLIG